MLWLDDHVVLLRRADDLCARCPEPFRSRSGGVHIRFGVPKRDAHELATVPVDEQVSSFEAVDVFESGDDHFSEMPNAIIQLFRGFTGYPDSRKHLLPPFSE